MMTLASLAFAVTALTAGPAAHKWEEPSVTLMVCNTEPVLDTEEVLLAAALAAQTWNAVGSGPRLDIVAGDCTAGAELDGVNTIGVATEWTYPKAAGAATTPWTKRRGDTEVGQIVDADVMLNPAFPWAHDENGALDVWSVLAHEFGHVLGLPDLSDATDATMYRTVHDGEIKKRDLSRTDEDNLIALYDATAPDSGCAQGGVPASVLALFPVLALVRRRRADQRHGVMASWR